MLCLRERVGSSCRPDPDTVVPTTVSETFSTLFRQNNWVGFVPTNFTKRGFTKKFVRVMITVGGRRLRVLKENERGFILSPR